MIVVVDDDNDGDNDDDGGDDDTKRRKSVSRLRNALPQDQERNGEDSWDKGYDYDDDNDDDDGDDGDNAADDDDNDDEHDNDDDLLVVDDVKEQFIHRPPLQQQFCLHIRIRNPATIPHQYFEWTGHCESQQPLKQ